MKEYVIGTALCFALFLAITNPEQVHTFFKKATTTESAAAAGLPVTTTTAQTSTTTQPPPTPTTVKIKTTAPWKPMQPAIVKEGANQGMWVRGLLMPADCHADQYPNLVAYVTQHNDPNDKTWYVPDSEVAERVCGVL